MIQDIAIALHGSIHTPEQAAAALSAYATAHPRTWRTLRPAFEQTLGARLDTAAPTLPLVRLDFDRTRPRVRVGVRARAGLLATVLATIAVASAALLSGCASSAHGTSAPGASVGQQSDATLPAAVMDATLITATQRLDLAELAGKVVVISDMMTLCQETCPLDTANVVAAARAAQRAGLSSKIVFLSVTIDPQRDTVPRLAAYQRLFAPAPADWLVATGAPTQLAAFWKSLGVFIQKVPDTPPAPKDWLTGKPLTYDLTHSDEVFFLDAHGRERFLLEGAPHVPAGTSIPRTLLQFMDATGRANLTRPNAQAWTLPQELQVLSWLTGHRIAA